MVRVVHYLNQFFAGIGGEDRAHVGPGSAAGPVGPGAGLSTALGASGELVGSVWCGDNYVAESTGAVDEIVGLIRELRPDVVVAGPSFSAGRYGLACAEVCVAVQEQLGVPAIAAMHEESPVAHDLRKKVVIVPTSSNAAGMNQALAAGARLAAKLGSGEPLLAPAEDGYLSRGVRRNEFASERASARSVTMLTARLAGKPLPTELPLPVYARVAAPAPLGGQPPLVAFVTESGLVPEGNPERMPSGWCRSWATYDIAGLSSLEPDRFDIIHGGFDTTAGNGDPNRLVPLDLLRELEQQGRIRLCNVVYATCGNMGARGEMQRIGREIAEDLRARQVEAVIAAGT
jgi:glycine reductase complex component B subunit gamma